MNLLQEHLTLVISSSIVYSVLISNMYVALLICILYVALICHFIRNNLSRKYEYLTTCMLSLIFFYSGLDLICNKNYNHIQLKLYAMSLCFYHFMEYIFNLVYHPKKVNFDSFLINQSKEYLIALAISLFEYIIEYFLFRESKFISILIIPGLILITIGHVFRTGAMFTAKSNFTHLIAFSKRKSHSLVKSGFYSISRHPSYFGFFAWTIGTQCLLVNPICIVGYAITTWMFFNSRIRSEEIYLITFFGADYIEYKKSVPILIPCMNIEYYNILVISLSEEEEMDALNYHSRFNIGSD